jgi:hypothetical protein
MRGEARVPRGADPKHAPPRRKGLGAESEEKREPVIAFVNAITDAEIDAAFATQALQHAKLKSRSAAVRVMLSVGYGGTAPSADDSQWSRDPVPKTLHIRADEVIE